jgi:hypothetical protein
MAQGTLKLHSPSSMPLLTTPGPPAASTPQSRSRLGQSRSNRRVAATAVSLEEDDLDLDAEGEEDEDADGEGEEGEDKALYCFCQQMSHGEVRFVFLSSSESSSIFYLIDGRMRQPRLSLSMGS